MPNPTRRAHEHPPQDFSKVYNEVPSAEWNPGNWFTRKVKSFIADIGLHFLDSEEVFILSVLSAVGLGYAAFSLYKRIEQNKH